MFYWLRYRNKPQVVHIDTIPKPEITPHHHNPTSQYGVGGALARLNNLNLPEKLRTDALLAIGSAKSSASNQILQNELADPADEVRLLAFSMIDLSRNTVEPIDQCIKRKINRSTRYEARSTTAKRTRHSILGTCIFRTDPKGNISNKFYRSHLITY